MATLLKTYSEYKKVDLNFANQVPSDWNILRGKFFFREVNERSAKGQEQLLSVSEHKGIVPRDSINVNMFQPISYEGYKLCKEGDIVINSLWAWHRGLGVSEHCGIVSTAYGVLRPLKPKQWNCRYLNYLLRNKSYVGECLIRSKGVWESRLQLTGGNFLDIPVICPPIKTQSAIVEYLDKKNEEIEKFIRNKERLIELLEEEKNTLIRKFVTKGIDCAEFKDSNVDWIGQIPKHWTMKKLRFLCNITTGGKNTEDKINDGKYPFFVRSQIIERINSYSFDGEAILTAGDGAGVGKVFHYINGKFDYHQRVYNFYNFKTVMGLYLFYYIKTNFHNVALMGDAKSTVDSLRLPLIKDFEITYPSRKGDQQEIIDKIEKESLKIDDAISKAQKEISAIKEYRESLITDLVLGKRGITNIIN